MILILVLCISSTNKKTYILISEQQVFQDYDNQFNLFINNINRILNQNSNTIYNSYTYTSNIDKGGDITETKEEKFDFNKFNLKKYILSENNFNKFNMIFSGDYLYILYKEKVNDKVINVKVKPIFFNARTNISINRLFTHRKNLKEVVPIQVASKFNNYSQVISGLYFYGFNGDTINFKYLCDKDIIVPYEDKKRIEINNISVKINTKTQNYWVRTYISSPPYNKEYTYLKDNMLLCSSQKNEIFSKEYIYDIYILEKSTEYIKFNKREPLKITSSLDLNKDMKHFNFITEFVSQGANLSDTSFTIYAEITFD
jgi:hypothetical protein